MSHKNIYKNKYEDTSNFFAVTQHLWFKWKGSCLKLLWHHIAIWMTCYTMLSIIYRFILFPNPRSRQMFELVCIYADRFSGLVPITILTAFYVAQVVRRWWDQFMALPWPDCLALKLVSFLPGTVNMTDRKLFQIKTQ